MIWGKSEAKIFLREGWTTGSPKDPTGKSMRTVIPGHGCGQIDEVDATLAIAGQVDV
jgi:hypothetical protein